MCSRALLLSSKNYAEDILVTLPEPRREKVTHLLTAHPVSLLQ